jgi:cysteine desulfuration protein SufE
MHVTSSNASTDNPVVKRQEKLAQEFAQAGDWEARYKLLIEKGKHLPALPPEIMTDTYKVKGCQSQVWLHAGLSPDGRVELRADSDALIAKGLVAVLLEVYSNTKPDEILAAPTTFLKDLGFEGGLSPSRANGLYAMLKQILYYAQAFQALARMKH